MDSRIRQLLDTIVNQLEAPMEEKAAELSNPAANQMGADSPDELARGVGARARARDLEDPFELALRAARRAGSTPLRLDSADAIQNRMADALIQFLVRPGLATVQSVEMGVDRYRYDLTIDWPALRRVATQAGINLEEALGVQS
ncbi:MAG TPA: hypothetical protein VGP33_11360 [Chloroflexota bacterium]|nr:hypothetical protein [Chloroflexota bacterium]